MNRLISQLFSKLIDSLSKNKSEYSKNYPFQFDKVQGLIFFNQLSQCISKSNNIQTDMSCNLRLLSLWIILPIISEKNVKKRPL